MVKKNNFRKVWKTLTELGQEFGVSAVKFGNLLKQYGLREKDGEPSQMAKDGGFFEKITPNERIRLIIYGIGKKPLSTLFLKVSRKIEYQLKTLKR
ncbi:hypothetical protein [Brasilonema bromeliae]|uniref:hypothetical protein n=1 Tax=Brasilonema bromeliae TaxID=383615 RepID=UPI0030DA867B